MLTYILIQHFAENVSLVETQRAQYSVRSEKSLQKLHARIEQF